jgi:hypothetical protein
MDKYIVTLKQSTIKPDGTQVLAVYGTIDRLNTSPITVLIGGRLRILDADIYTSVKHNAAVNEELIWVL